jgi:hypothetical protein
VRARFISASLSPSGATIGGACDSGGTPSIAQSTEDFHTLSLVSPWPALNFGSSAHAAKALSGFEVKRADANAGRRQVNH